MPKEETHKPITADDIREKRERLLREKRIIVDVGKPSALTLALEVERQRRKVEEGGLGDARPFSDDDRII